MSLFLLKVLTIGGACCGAFVPSTIFLVGGAGCGIIVAPVATILSGKGVWVSRGVFIIARSDDDSVLLFVQEKELPSSTNERKETKLELVAEHNWLPVKNDWMLCSPLTNKDQYFLFNSNGETFHSSWTTMKGDTKICESLRDNKDLGKSLSIKFEEARANSKLPKTIFLKNCTINDLRLGDTSAVEEGKPSVELTCWEDQWNRQQKQIKLFDQGFVYI